MLKFYDNIIIYIKPYETGEFKLNPKNRILNNIICAEVSIQLEYGSLEFQHDLEIFVDFFLPEKP